MTTKRPLPMLFAGIAMILYPVIEILTIILQNILSIMNYTSMFEAGYIDISQIFIIFGKAIGEGISNSIWLLLLAVVGIMFIIAFIKPCKALYIVSFVLLGLLGLIFGIVFVIGGIVMLLAIPLDMMAVGGNVISFASCLVNVVEVSVIHGLATILLAVFALLSLIPKAGKVISKFWILPTILSGVELVVSSILFIIIRTMLGVTVVGAITASLFNLPIIGFTACILLAGLGMSSMVKNNFGKSAE